MKKILIVILILTVFMMAGCNNDVKIEENVEQNNNNIQQQEVLISNEENNIKEKSFEEEIEPYLEFFYHHISYYNFGGFNAAYVATLETSSLFRDLFDLNAINSGDAQVIHNIIKETVGMDTPIPLEKATKLTDEQEKLLDDGGEKELLYDAIDSDFAYHKNKLTYITFVGDSFGGNIFFKIMDIKNDNNVYTIKYNVWNLPEDLTDEYATVDIMEDGIKRVSFNWEKYYDHLINDVKPDHIVEIQLQENKDYKYSKYKMIDYKIIEDSETEKSKLSVNDLYGKWYISSAVNEETAEKETDVNKIIGRQSNSEEIFLELKEDGTFIDNIEKTNNSGTYKFFESYNREGDSRVVLMYTDGSNKLTTIMFFDESLSTPYIGYGTVNGYDVYLKKMSKKFDAHDYDKDWNGIKITVVDNNTINLSYEEVGGEPYNRIVSINASNIKLDENGYGEFNFEDSWNSTGKAAVQLKEGKISLKLMEYNISETAMMTLSLNSEKVFLEK